MTPWDEIKREYLAGIQPKHLCEKYNLNYNTLSNRIQNDKWKAERNEIKQKIGEKVAILESEAIQSMRESERTHTDLMINAILSRLLLNDEINPELNTQDINNLVNSYEKIQRIKYKSYGIKDGLELDITTPTDTDFKIVKK